MLTFKVRIFLSFTKIWTTELVYKVGTRLEEGRERVLDRAVEPLVSMSCVSQKQNLGQQPTELLLRATSSLPRYDRGGMAQGCLRHFWWSNSSQFISPTPTCVLSLGFTEQRHSDTHVIVLHEDGHRVRTEDNRRNPGRAVAAAHLQVAPSIPPGVV